MEIWKPVKGYEKYYAVSNKGRIRSLDRVILFKDGKTRKFQRKYYRICIQKFKKQHLG